jgi:hypothetical protein
MYVALSFFKNQKKFLYTRVFHGKAHAEDGSQKFIFLILGETASFNFLI